MLMNLSEMLIIFTCFLQNFDFLFLKMFLKCEKFKYIWVLLYIYTYIYYKMLLVKTHIRSTIKKPAGILHTLKCNKSFLVSFW